MTERQRRLAVAVRRDARLMRAVHPVATPLLDAVPGPARRVPGLGVVVKDAGLVRQVLLDAEGFSKAGKGASSELWTPASEQRPMMWSLPPVRRAWFIAPFRSAF